MNMQLTKSPIGLDGVPAAETVLSHVDGERGELIIAGERVGDLAAQDRLRRRDRAAVERREPASRSAKPRCAPRSARRASAPSPGCRTCCRHTRGLSIVDGFRAAIAGLRAENGLTHEATIVGAFPVIAGALVQRAQGRDPIAPDPTVSHAADTLSMLLGRKPARARGGGARRLFRHGVRSRHERLDLHDARGGLDPGRPVRGRHGGILRADRAAAWRRAGAGAGNARRDRHPRAHQAVGRRRAGARRAADGLWPSRLSGARSPRRRAEGRDRAARRPTAPICPSRARSRPISARRCGGKIRTGRSRPMWSSSPRSCSTR